MSYSRKKNETIESMCGICGTFGISDRSLIQSMCQVMVHRGPDDEGIYLDKEIGLGFRRLSIIDLEKGHQPISNEDSTVWVVSNGEIYNYLALRKELIKRGHIFKTNSDTESIVHCYEEFGENFVKKLDGMFAFALWDSRKKQLLLARDRVGIKPLYYYVESGKLLFASEIKAILKYANVSKDINWKALDQYITFRYVPAPDTIFKNIKKLPGGNIILCRKDYLAIKPYWDLDFNTYSHRPETYYKQRLKEILSESVRMHLISDVPIGAFLSGGIDSSSLVGIMKGMQESPVETFSVGFEAGEPLDELRYARLVSSTFDTGHHEIILSPPSHELLYKIAWHLDEPIADPALIPTYLLSELAGKSVKVVLTGEGADEAFGGYSKYRFNKLALLYHNLPSIMGKKMLLNFARHLPILKRYNSHLKNISLPELERFFHFSTDFTATEKDNLYTPELKEKIKGDYSPDEEAISLFENHLKNKNFNDSLSKMLYLDTKTSLVDNLLMKVDKMSMAHSLEARVPFLDHKLLEFAATIPSSMKLKGFTTKYILREAMGDILPDEIKSRKKHVFGLPLRDWFAKELRELLMDTFSEKKVKERGFFNFTFCRQLLQNHIEGKRDESMRLWILLCFELWCQTYLDSKY